MLTPVEITEDSIDVESIKAVGIGGSYLMRPETLKHCRTEFFLNDLFRNWITTPGPEKEASGVKYVLPTFCLNDLVPMRNLTLIRPLKPTWPDL